MRRVLFWMGTVALPVLLCIPERTGFVVVYLPGSLVVHRSDKETLGQRSAPLTCTATLLFRQDPVLFPPTTEGPKADSKRVKIVYRKG
ncbi:hypothetical protein RUM43_007258 [Polyplax serrata]|uniref:Secreted protein n=1 Tax=Polyplax serrata TaxID=468196 RepID=A0AAN8S1D6_POLSC